MRTPVKVSVLTAAVALSFSCSLLRGRSSRAVLDPAPLQQLLDEAVAHPHRVGVSAAIGRCGELEWSGAAGSAGPDTPMTPATASRIGSISKLMTMVAFMRLRDRGHIALDTPVGALLPELPDTLRPITARQIMAHRSGVRHYKDREFWRNTAYRTSQEALPIFQDDPLLFPPGTGQSYSTYAFTLLSAAMAEATGQRFPTLVRSQVIEPAGMSRTRAENSDDPAIDRVSEFHRVVNERLFVAPEVNSSYKWAGGGYLSTAPDLVRFANALLGHQLLERDTLLETIHSAYEPDASFAIAWDLHLLENLQSESGALSDVGRLRRALAGSKLIGHGGGSMGARAILYVVPDREIVVAGLSNTEEKPSFAIALLLAALDAPPCGTSE